MGWLFGPSGEQDRLELGRRARNHLHAQQQEEFRKQVAREASETRRREREQAARDAEDAKLAAKNARAARQRQAREDERQKRAAKKAAIRARPGTPAKAYKTPGKRSNGKGWFS